jgi:hypothetical protein
MNITDPMIYKPAKKWSIQELQDLTVNFNGMYQTKSENQK